MVSNGGFSYFVIYFKNLTQDVMGTVSQGSQKLIISGPGFLSQAYAKEVDVLVNHPKVLCTLGILHRGF